MEQYEFLVNIINNERYILVKNSKARDVILHKNQIISVLLQAELIIMGNYMKYRREKHRLLIRIEDDKKVDKYYTYFKLNTDPKKPYEFVGEYHFESYEKAYISFKQDGAESNRYVLLLKDGDFEISWYYTLVNGNFIIDRPVYSDLDDQRIDFVKTKGLGI